MKVGYVRKLINEQDMLLQINALKQSGCELIYQEKQSRRKNDRRELQQCINSLREDDILIVFKLDRLSNNLQHLIEVVKDLEKRSVGFQSLSENIDTGTADGKQIYKVFGYLAEFEQRIVRDKVIAEIEATNKKSKKLEGILHASHAVKDNIDIGLKNDSSEFIISNNEESKENILHEDEPTSKIKYERLYLYLLCVKKYQNLIEKYLYRPKNKLNSELFHAKVSLRIINTVNVVEKITNRAIKWMCSGATELTSNLLRAVTIKDNNSCPA
jgi:DNA invertase Pin-like site-specific DNA recombinase